MNSVVFAMAQILICPNMTVLARGNFSPIPSKYSDRVFSPSIKSRSALSEVEPNPYTPGTDGA